MTDRSNDSRGVGRVLGTQHTSTSEFRVVLNDEDYLQLDDLVVVRTEVPKRGEIRTYGVVTEVEAIYEGATFESDTHRFRAGRSDPTRSRAVGVVRSRRSGRAGPGRRA